VEAAELNLSYTEITAPVNGVGDTQQVEPGQIVQAGQGYWWLCRWRACG